MKTNIDLSNLKILL